MECIEKFPRTNQIKKKCNVLKLPYPPEPGFTYAKIVSISVADFQNFRFPF